MVYDALDIAAYVVKRCHENNTTVSNLKLQKILYFIQAQFLVFKDDICFHQRIEAWSFGPVVPDVYQNYKIYGGAAIPFSDTKPERNISSSDLELMNRIIDKCSKYEASDLVEITHIQKPWKDAYIPRANNEILPMAIKSFFKRKKNG